MEWLIDGLATGKRAEHAVEKQRLHSE